MKKAYTLTISAAIILAAMALLAPSTVHAQYYFGTPVTPWVDAQGVSAPWGRSIVEDMSEINHNLDEGGDGGPRGSTVGTSITTNGYAACWVSYCPVRERNRIPLGDAYGRYTSGGRSAGADAYYDSADCGDGSEGGAIDHGDSIEFFITKAYHIDEVSNDGGKTYYRLRLDEYCGSGCASACTDITDKSDTASCLTTTSEQTWLEAIDIEGDTSDCHRPDIVVSSGSSWYPPSRGTYGYEYLVESWVCDSDGTGCTYGADTGCVDIVFE